MWGEDHGQDPKRIVGNNYIRVCNGNKKNSTINQFRGWNFKMKEEAEDHQGDWFKSR